MRLYSLTEDVPAIDHAGQTYLPDENGGFDLPDDAIALLHSSAVGGARQWETGPERQLRTAQAELRRKQGPEALYDMFERFLRTVGTAAVQDAAVHDDSDAGDDGDDKKAAGAARSRKPAAARTAG